MADRTFSKAFEIGRAAPGFMYLEDLSLADGSGLWRPLRASDFAGGGGGGTDMGPTILAIASGNNSAAAASVVSSAVYTGSFLGKEGAGEVHSIFGYCSGNSQFLRIFDGTGVNGTLISVIGIDQQNNFFADFSAHGARVTAGIFVAFSSSPTSHVPTGADGIITIVYK